MLKKVEGATKYGGTDLSGEGSLFPKAKKNFITTVVNRLENRFDDVEATILASTKIANLSLWPEKENLDGIGPKIKTNPFCQN